MSHPPQFFTQPHFVNQFFWLVAHHGSHAPVAMAVAPAAAGVATSCGSNAATCGRAAFAVAPASAGVSTFGSNAATWGSSPPKGGGEWTSARPEFDDAFGHCCVAVGAFRGESEEEEEFVE